MGISSRLTSIKQHLGLHKPTKDDDMVKGLAEATVNGTVVAEADEWEVVEGNVYFPPASLRREYLRDSSLHTRCPWKGEASYYTLAVGDTELKDAAWYYPEPLEKATHIKNSVAFYKNKVTITTS